jgi:hypothetical protein
VDLDTIEWKSDNNVAAIPYRLLVRVFRTSRDEKNYTSPVDMDSAGMRISQPDFFLPSTVSQGLATSPMLRSGAGRHSPIVDVDAVRARARARIEARKTVIL